MQSTEEDRKTDMGNVKRVRFEDEADGKRSPIQDSTELSEIAPNRRSTLHVEVILHPACPIPTSTLRLEIEKFVYNVGTLSFMYEIGPLNLTGAPSLLQQTCKLISINEWESPLHLSQSNTTTQNSSSTLHHDSTILEERMHLHDVLIEKTPSIASWNISNILIHIFTLSEEEAELEDIDTGGNGDDSENLTACETLPLPHSSLHTLWDNIILPGNIKRNLLAYAQTALLFSEKQVSPHIITWNRVLLLHGPAGTGKTSLCRSLAHKLSIRLSNRFPSGGFLMEIHSHSLFSKWFSESGKLVHTLFQHIRQMIENEPDGLFCLLVDEVESLATSRIGSSSSGSSEPSDAIRAVNALLTSLDQLKRYQNVIILTTTNITGSVDVAFVDRADMKQYIGLPCLAARYQILKGCILELIRVGLILPPRQQKSNSDVHGDTQSSDTSLLLHASIHQEKKDEHFDDHAKTNKESSNLLYQAALLSDGFSGRCLRRIPFQTHAFHVNSSHPVNVEAFLEALCVAIQNEKSSVIHMVAVNKHMTQK